MTSCPARSGGQVKIVRIVRGSRLSICCEGGRIPRRKQVRPIWVVPGLVENDRDGPDRDNAGFEPPMVFQPLLFCSMVGRDSAPGEIIRDFAFVFFLIHATIYLKRTFFFSISIVTRLRAGDCVYASRGPLAGARPHPGACRSSRRARPNNRCRAAC